MVLFDVQQRTSVADLSTPFIKYVVWSADMNHVALLSKHAIIIANRRLGQASTGAPRTISPAFLLVSVSASISGICAYVLLLVDKLFQGIASNSLVRTVIDTGAVRAVRAVHETIRVKSAAWDDSGVLIYTTLNHIKYCLPNGDSGIIRTLDVPVYITKVFGSTIYCLDRDGKNRQIQVRLGPDSLSFLIRLSPVMRPGVFLWLPD